jgi:hypothetical protein
MPIDQADDFIQGNEGAQSEVGKYLLIDVPDYNKGTQEKDYDDNGIPKPTNKMRSFLRLGAAPKNWMEELGADLVSLVYQVGPSGKEPVAGISERFPAGTAPEGELCPPFIDDQRYRGTGKKNADGAEGHGLTPEQRAEISAMLHTRGGWRDHTEGNRITTTRGDKIEIIEGNYKLIVMGRQTDPENGTGFELNGNNIQDFAATAPGAAVTVSWVKEAYEEGAWMIQKADENLFEYARKAGSFKEEIWGDLVESYIGSENPERRGSSKTAGTQGHPTDHTPGPWPQPTTPMPVGDSTDMPRGNPWIISKTWAEKIDTGTGSAVWKIPLITSDTWAVAMVDNVNAEHIKNKTTAQSLTDTTIAAANVETTISSMTIGTHIGIRTGLDVGVATDIVLGLKADVTVGYTYTFDTAKDEMALVNTKITVLETQMAATKTELTATKTELTTVKTELNTTNTELNTTKTTLATTQTTVSNLKADVANLIFLG